jgi:hypothetical protein
MMVTRCFSSTLVGTRWRNTPTSPLTEIAERIMILKSNAEELALIAQEIGASD